MTGTNGKPHILFLIGVTTALSSWVALTVILTSVGFEYGAAVNMALAGALLIFGAFLYSIYKTFKATPAPQLTKTSSPRCLILAAPTHGVLQDRANYWLKGGYGKYLGSAMTMNEKGAYLAIFYDSEDPKELPNKGDQ